jgi:hypothetical protein
MRPLGRCLTAASRKSPLTISSRHQLRKGSLHRLVLAESISAMGEKCYGEGDGRATWNNVVCCEVPVVELSTLRPDGESGWRARVGVDFGRLGNLGKQIAGWDTGAGAYSANPGTLLCAHSADFVSHVLKFVGGQLDFRGMCLRATAHHSPTHPRTPKLRQLWPSVLFFLWRRAVVVGHRISTCIYSERQRG